jgi:Cdc6-like AAA superfamily ATPase
MTIVTTDFDLMAAYNNYDLKKTFSDAQKKSRRVKDMSSTSRQTFAANFEDPDDFAQILFPLPVNPSNKNRTEIITKTYTFGNESQKPTANNQSEKSTAINYNEESCLRFVHDVIDRTDRLYHATDDDSTLSLQAAQKYEIVEGKKGVGKTHFQNYILSKYSELFDNNSIVWVRINMVRKFGKNNEIDIYQWAKFQICKVILRYYDSSSECFLEKKSNKEMIYEWKPHLLEFVKSSYRESMELWAKAHQEALLMISRLQKKELDSDISPDWMPSYLVDEVFNHARSKLGMKFVLVIDGLDLLAGTQAMRSKFQLTHDALVRFLLSDAPARVYSIVFMRPRTYDTMKEIVQGIQSNNTNHSTPIFRQVCSCDIERMFFKRIEYLISKDSVLRPSTSNVAHFVEFITKEPSDVISESGTSYTWLELIKFLAKDNARVATQILSSLPNAFSDGSQIPSNRTDSKYRFIEACMIGRGALPAKSYSYHQIKSGRLIREAMHSGQIYDTMFLPSVFDFPYPNNKTSNEVFKKVPFGNYILGLRILQILLLLERSEVRKANVRALKNVMHHIFGFDLKILKMVFEEFAESEIVDTIKDTKIMAAGDIDNYSVKLSNKGRRIVNSFIDDVSYMALCLFTAPLPDRLIDARNPNVSGFRLISPRLNSLPEWIEAKVVNAFSMMKLLSYANTDQRHRVSAQSVSIAEKIEQLPVDSRWRTAIQEMLSPDGSIYQRIDEMEQKVVESAHKAIDGHSSATVTRGIYDRLAHAFHIE